MKTYALHKLFGVFVVMPVLIFLIVGCDDPNAPPKPVGHVEISKIDGRVTKLKIDLNRSNWTITSRNEAVKLKQSLEMIVKDMESAIEEMYIEEPKKPVRPPDD